ncbi:MAG: desaturase [Archangium sp.]
MSPPVRRGTAPGRHVYDVIVIGGQVSGIIATALLAKRGLQVLHVPHDGLNEPYAHGDTKVPLAPFLIPPVKGIPAFDEALSELGVSAVISRALQTTPLQLLEQERWFELSHDEKRRGPELARALGDDAEAFDELTRKAQSSADASDAFFQSKPDLPPDGLIARWKFKRHLARFAGLETDTPLPVDQLLGKLRAFIGAADVPLARARTLGRTLAGPMLFPGGREGLWSQLADRARELGADVLPSDEPVERLVLEGSGAGVRLSRHDAVYRGAFVIAAMDLDVLTRLVPDKQQKASAKVLPQLTADKALFTLHLSVPERALPRGLGALALVAAPELDGGAALLQVLPGANAESRVLAMGAIAPVGLRAGGEPAGRALAAQLHAAIARVMPFTKSHATTETTPWLDAPRVVAGVGEPAPLFQLPESSWLGVSGHATQSPWKRVLLASRQVLPGLGFEGEVLAAQRAARVVETALRKNDPLKRKTA